jgi:hypothetical protein
MLQGHMFCRNPTLKQMWGALTLPKMGLGSFPGLPKNLERDFRGQNTLH